MISIQSLNKTYGRGAKAHVALQDVSLEIEQGDVFGIIGKSGAGKSTLIRCLNRLEEPTSGKVVVDGQDLCSLDPKQLRLARRQIGMIFQHFNLLSRKTVYDNIAMPLKYAGLDERSIASKVEPLLALTGLQDHQNKYPSQLSGGQKQRVAIARALAPSPKLLLSDEATSALDPTTTRSILELLKNINQELGVTIVLITHEMDVVKQICDKVAIIHDSRIIEHSSVLSLFANPQTEVAMEFIKSSSKLDLSPQLQARLIHKPTEASGTLIRISYHGDSASQPIIGFLMQKYQITVNILQGHIDIIQGQTVGIMIVEVAGSGQDVEQAIEFLKRNELNVEVLGYV